MAAFVGVGFKMTDLAKLHDRVTAYFNSDPNEPAGRLILDLMRAVRQTADGSHTRRDPYPDANATVFKIGATVLENKPMVEVWQGGVFVAGIYPSEGKNVRGETRYAIKVISKYFEDYCYYTDGETPGAINLLMDLKQ
jgi:hypothetical protein